MGEDLLGFAQYAAPWGDVRRGGRGRRCAASSRTPPTARSPRPTSTRRTPTSTACATTRLHGRRGRAAARARALRRRDRAPAGRPDDRRPARRHAGRARRGLRRPRRADARRGRAGRGLRGRRVDVRRALGRPAGRRLHRGRAHRPGRADGRLHRRHREPGPRPAARSTWDFGDGGTATGAPGATVTHTYADEGPYTVTRDRHGRLRHRQLVAQISPGLPNQSPTAAFTATPQSGDAPLEVRVRRRRLERSRRGRSRPTTGTSTTRPRATGRPSITLFTAPDAVHRAADRHRRSRRDRDDDQHTVTVTQPPHAPEAGRRRRSTPRRPACSTCSPTTRTTTATRSRWPSNSQAAHGTVACAPAGRLHLHGGERLRGRRRVHLHRRATRAGARRRRRCRHRRGAAGRRRAGRPRRRGLDAAGPRWHVRRAGQRRRHAAASSRTRTQPEHGTATCSPGGSCTYTPEAGFSGVRRLPLHDRRRRRRRVEGGGPRHRRARRRGVRRGGRRRARSGHQRRGARTGASASRACRPALVTTRSAALPRPTVTATLSGAHTIEPDSVRTAPRLDRRSRPPPSPPARHAGAGALLGEADTQLLAKPLPPTARAPAATVTCRSSSAPRSSPSSTTRRRPSSRASTARRASLCPGYPIATNMTTNSLPGHAAVAGTRIYMRLDPAQTYPQTAPLGLYCWDTATARPCGYVVARRFGTTSDPGASSAELVAGKVYNAGDGGRLYCVDPATDQAVHVDRDRPGGRARRQLRHRLPRHARLRHARSATRSPAST